MLRVNIFSRPRDIPCELQFQLQLLAPIQFYGDLYLSGNPFLIVQVLLRL